MKYPENWDEMSEDERWNYTGDYINDCMDDYEDREIMEGLD